MNMDLFTIITTLISLVISLISVISSKPTIHQQINTNIYVESPRNSAPPLLQNPDEIVFRNTSFVKKILSDSIYFSMLGIAIGSFMYKIFSLSKSMHFKVSFMYEATHFLLVTLCQYTALITVTLLLLLVYRTIKLHSLPFRILNIIGFSFSAVTNIMMLPILYKLDFPVINQFTATDPTQLTANFMYAINFIVLVFYLAYLAFTINELIKYIFSPIFNTPFWDEKCKYIFRKFIVFFGGFLSTLYWAYILIKHP